MTTNGFSHGIVAMFDVLGYVNFLENNHGNEAVATVLDTILDKKDGISEIMRSMIQGNSEIVKTVVDGIKWLVFSDTILLTCACDERDAPNIKAAKWAGVIYASVILMRDMFEYGLPLRGAIATGEYMVRETCFAGRPIVEAYLLSQDLDVAACVMTPDAYRQAHDVSTHPGEMKNLSLHLPAMFFEYPVPLKDGRIKELQTLNILGIGPDWFRKFVEGDIGQIVRSSFEGHGKTVLPQCERKVKNTEQLIQYSMNLIKPFWEAQTKQQS